MNRGKSTPLSNNERDFILSSITDRIRLDKREAYDYRDIDINIDEDSYGMVEARIGNTRVLTRVSCDVVAPKAHRPREGVLYFQVELTPLASPQFDIGSKNSQTAVEVCRLLERTIRDSRAVDLESLCIVTGEKVWEVRVSVNVLDHCGNLIDCAALATITALKHFKRPDVSICGQETIIHPITERLPVPLTVYHIPLCVTFAFFSDGDYLLVDPTDKEEEVMDGRLIVGANEHEEICALHLAGGVGILPDQIIRCFQIAAAKCKEHSAKIQVALEAVSTQSCSPLEEVRESYKSVNNVMDTSEPSTSLQRNGDQTKAQIQETLQENIKILDSQTAILEPQLSNPWDPPSNSESSDEDIMIIETVAPSTSEDANGKTAKQRNAAPRPKKQLPKTKKHDSNSEEDDVIILDADESFKPSRETSKGTVSGNSSGAAVSRKRPRRKKKQTKN